MMQSITRSASTLSSSARSASRTTMMAMRSKSTTSSNPLQGDSGNIATHIHHKITTFLAVATPIYFLAPIDTEATSTSLPNKAIGTLLAINLSAHSWIGLNYVITDSIPKISKSLTGPARLATAALTGVTLLGLGKVANNDSGGIRGTVTGLWRNRKGKDDQEKKWVIRVSWSLHVHVHVHPVRNCIVMWFIVHT